MNPSVTVIVPCYNYARFLDDCVSSLLAQDGVDLMVLILDDASTDDTPMVASRLAESDSRVKSVRHEVNRGHIATYNHGLELSRSTYTALVSADDLLAPGALQRAADVMEGDPSISFVYGPGKLFSTQPPAPDSSSAHRGWRKHGGLNWISRVCRIGENLMVSPEVVVRTSAQRQVGGYDPRLPHSGDLEMWLRLAQVGDVGEVLGGTHAYIRQHGSSMRHTVFADAMKSLEQRRRAFEFALARLESNGVDCSPMMRAVNDAVARDALWSIIQMLWRRQFDVGRARALLEYAARTAYEGRTRKSGPLRYARLWSPFVDGLRRWPRGWIKARQRGRAAVPG